MLGLVDQLLYFLNVLGFLLLLPSEKVCVLANELLHEVFGALSLSFSPLVEYWLEEALVVLSH